MDTESPPSDNLHVTGLPADISEETLRGIFAPYGTLVQCKVLPTTPGSRKGAALLRFSSTEQASYVALSVNGGIPPGLTEPLSVKFEEAPNTYGKADDSKTGSHRYSPYSASSGDGGGHHGSSGGGSGRPAGEEPPPSDNLYVTGLPAGIDDQLLKQLFDTHGRVVQCKVLSNPQGGQAKVAALVRFESVEKAQAVKENLNGSVLTGLAEPVSVTFADVPQPKEQRAQQKDCIGIQQIVSGFEAAGALPGTKGFGNDANELNTLYIAGLPSDTEDMHLYRLFSPFGAITPKGARVVANPDGSCKGIGFVNFLEAAAAQAAIMTYNGAVMPDGSMMKVAVKTNKSANETRD